MIKVANYGIHFKSFTKGKKKMRVNRINSIFNSFLTDLVLNILSLYYQRFAKY